MLSNLKSFDAYPKTLEDFRVRTLSGAVGMSWGGWRWGGWMKIGKRVGGCGSGVNVG